MNSIRESFGKRIREARELRGMSTAELAAALSVSETTVQYWETSELELPDAITKKIVGILDVSLSYLLGESDDPGYKLLSAKKTPPEPPFRDRRKSRLWLRDLPPGTEGREVPNETFSCLKMCGDLLITLQNEGVRATPDDLAALARQLEKLRLLTEALMKKKT